MIQQGTGNREQGTGRMENGGWKYLNENKKIRTDLAGER